MPWVSKLSKLSKRKSRLTSAAITVGLFTASIAVRFLFDPVLVGMKFLTFYPTIALTTLLCGWRYGGAILIGGMLSGWYFFMEPYNSFALQNASTSGSIVGFLMVGSFEILLVSALRETIRRLEIAKIAQETLFSELQHRVANDLQLVIALLRNAQRNLRNPVAAAEILTDAEERIFAMSQLHRRLHDGTAFVYGLEPLLREMLAATFRDLPVKVRVDVNGVTDLSMDRMTAIALLVNEAALNSAKHVFSKGRGSLFQVSLAKEPSGGLNLEISDDGPGAADQTGSSSLSLGMGLMEAFAKQLGGALEVDQNSGMSLCVKFGSP